jgi:hypothetical protein
MKTLLLTILLTIGALAQVVTSEQKNPFNVPIIGPSGFAYWDVSPPMNQLFGQAGQGPNQVVFVLQGFAGVAYLSAPTIQFYSIEFAWNGKRIIPGPPDSGGKGYRILLIEN